MEEGSLNKYSDFQKENFLTDIKIKLSNGFIEAHRLILAASCDFFRLLFRNPSFTENSAGMVELPMINYETFQFILDFMYGRITSTIPYQNLSLFLEVAVASEFLGILQLQEIIDTDVAANFQIAYLRSLDAIYGSRLQRTVRRCFKSVATMIQSKDETLCNCISPESFLLLIKDDAFAVEENILMDFLASFIGKNQEVICPQLRQELLENIRTPFLDEDRFNVLCRLRQENDMSTSVDRSSRFPRSTAFIYITNRVSDDIKSVSRVDLSDGSLTEVLKVPPFSYNTCVSFGHNLFLGKDSVSGFDDCLGRLFELTTGKYKQITPPPPSLLDSEAYFRYSGFAMLLLPPNLFFMGGLYNTLIDETFATARVLGYNLDTGVWTAREMLPDLKEASWQHAVVSDSRLPRTVYVSGGCNFEGQLRLFYSMDMTTKVLTDLPPLPVEISKHRMYSSRDIVILFDSCRSHDVLLFHLTDRIWRILNLSVCHLSTHLSYCFQESTGAHILTKYELVQDFRKDTVSLYGRQIRPDGSILNPEKSPSLVTASWKFDGAHEVQVAMSVYGSGSVVDS